LLFQRCFNSRGDAELLRRNIAMGSVTHRRGDRM
jgi:hypothetical protein